MLTDEPTHLKKTPRVIVKNILKRSKESYSFLSTVTKITFKNAYLHIYKMHQKYWQQKGEKLKFIVKERKIKSKWSVLSTQNSIENFI